MSLFIILFEASYDSAVCVFGVFYGGVTIVGIMGKYIEPVPPKWVLWAMAAGVVVMFAGILFAFSKIYRFLYNLALGHDIVS